RISMEELVIYIDSQRARELDQVIAKQKPTIFINSQKAYNLDQHLALQKLYYRLEGFYQNAKGL
ncbi:6780_t:CDS:1, partial [Dentiscutata erythropus]